VEEAIDSDEIQSDGFDKDGIDLPRPTVRVRQLPGLVIGDPNSKFGVFYTNQGAAWENQLLRDRMDRHGLKVTCRTQELCHITMAHNSRFGIAVITCLGRPQFISINTCIVYCSDGITPN
jgi:hypothetical protein